MENQRDTMMFTQILNAFELLNSLYDEDNEDTLDIALTRWYLSEHTENRNVHVMGLDKVYWANKEAFDTIFDFCYINNYKFHLKEFLDINYIPDMLISNLYSIKNFDVLIPIMGDSQLDTIKKVDQLISEDYIEENGKITIEVNINEEINPGDLGLHDELRRAGLESFHIPNNIYYSMIDNKDAIEIVKYIKSMEERHGKYDQLVIDTKNCPGTVSEREIIEVIKTCYIHGIECDITSDVHSTMANVYESLYKNIHEKLDELIKEYGYKVVITNHNFSRWFAVEINPVQSEGREGIFIKESDTKLIEGLEGFHDIDLEEVKKVSPIEKYIDREPLDSGLIRVIPECFVHGVGEKREVDWKHVFS